MRSWLAFSMCAVLAVPSRLARGGGRRAARRRDRGAGARARAGGDLRGRAGRDGDHRPRRRWTSVRRANAEDVVENLTGIRTQRRLQGEEADRLDRGHAARVHARSSSNGGRYSGADRRGGRPARRPARERRAHRGAARLAGPRVRHRFGRRRDQHHLEGSAARGLSLERERRRGATTPTSSARAPRLRPRQGGLVGLHRAGPDRRLRVVGQRPAARAPRRRTGTRGGSRGTSTRPCYVPVDESLVLRTRARLAPRGRDLRERDRHERRRSSRTPTRRRSATTRAGSARRRRSGS